MKKKSIALTIVLSLLCGLILAGCGAKEPEKVEEEAEKGIQIGFSLDSYLIERWERDRDLFVSKAEELGAEVNVQNANGEVERQISQIQYFIDKKMDVIVIVAIDADTLTEVVDKAHKAGIQVIAYDRLIRNADVDLYISFDNEKVGELMGDYLIKATGGKGSVIRINGSPTDNNVKMVSDGFNRVINNSKLTVDMSKYCDGWLSEIGFDLVFDYLASGKVPDGIMCGNDDVATQVIKALSEKRLAGTIPVVGQDAELAACQRIVEGTQYMTVYKPVENLAQRAAEMAVVMAEGKPLNVESVYNDGTYDVPYEKLEPIAVTKDNIDEVIVGKYHQRSDVYLNVRE